MMINRNQLHVCFLILAVSSSNSIFANELPLEAIETIVVASKPTFATFDNFNFLLEDEELHDVLEWSSSVLNKNNSTKGSGVEKKFDIDAIHSYLAENGTTGDGNMAVAAFTLLWQIGDKKYAITQIIHGDNEKDLCKFPSGFDKNLALSYWTKLFKLAKKRMNCNALNQNPHLSDIWAQVQETQKSAIQCMQEVVSNPDDAAFCLEIIDQFCLAHHQKMNRSEPSVTRINYGPLIDSEQHLLFKLENEFITVPEKPSLHSTGQLDTLLAQFKHQFQEQLKEVSLKFDPQKLADAETFDQEFQQAAKELEAKKTFFKAVQNKKMIGGILHVFSANEFCEFCASSLWCECYERESNFVQRCKHFMKEGLDGNPFFIILGSYGKILESAHSQEVEKIETSTSPKKHQINLRPVGTISGKIARPADSRYKTIQDLIKNQILPISLVKNKSIPLKIINKGLLVQAKDKEHKKNEDSESQDPK